MEKIDWTYCVPECGLCCVMLNYIHASEQDIERLKQNSIDVNMLIESGRIRKSGKHYELKKDCSDDACVFYSGGGICSVHEFKPEICRDFPFGKNNMLKQNDDCPATMIRRLEENGYAIRNLIRKKWLEKRHDKDWIFRITGVIAVLRNVFVYGDKFEGINEVSEKTIGMLYDDENLEKWLLSKQEPVIKKAPRYI